MICQSENTIVSVAISNHLIAVGEGFGPRDSKRIMYGTPKF